MTTRPQRSKINTVAIASLGAIGRVLAVRIAQDLPEYELTAVSARRQDRGKQFLESNDIACPVVDVERVANNADIVIECAPAALYRTIAERAVQNGKTLVTLSVGALLENWDLVEEARNTGARILVPSGAIGALDAIQGVAQGTVHSVQMITRKPVKGLKGAPYLAGLDIDLDSATTPVQIFHGTPREAIVGFPANLNVAVAVSLAGIGPDRTQMEVWADPSIDRNIHRVIVDSDSAHLDFSIQNIPTDNPATGRLTPLSVIALLKKMASPLQIGT